ncbi:MAG: glycosyltransferase family 2 protein [Verrucomicrobiota bacterium]
MEDAFPLSVFVVTLNEEANLRRCLTSLGGMAEEIIVVDSGSSDGTKGVADAFGARWFEREWAGFVDQKRYALEKCTRPWVMYLDADEELSGELCDEIRGFLERDGGGADGASFSRVTFFLGRWIRHGDWYPDVKQRLFRREKGRLDGHGGHEYVVMEGGGEVRAFLGELKHYSYPTTNDYLRKMVIFSDEHLRSVREKGLRWSLAGNLFRPWWRFFRSFVLRLGFLDGFPGLWIAVATGFGAFVRHSRLYEESVAERTRFEDGRGG